MSAENAATCSDEHSRFCSPCDTAKRYGSLHCGECGVPVPPRATVPSPAAAALVECECCGLRRCEQKSPGIGYYCGVCLSHWCWMQDVGRPGALHQTSEALDVEIWLDHERMRGETQPR